jgi:alginate O-acetyltransferase complex protein AlgI
MDFSSIQFIAFLSITLLLFYAVKEKYRWLVLLAASGVFIFSFSLYMLIFTLAFTLVNYFIGLGISKSKSDNIKALVYQAGIWINIGLLVFHKYINFLLDNIFVLLGKDISQNNGVIINVIVPLGISFYTFQTIGYLIDVKRGTKPAETNPGKFALFILYFPKFISGPVERTGNLIPQINKEITWNENGIYEGLLQTLWGFFKTIVISDRLAMFVNGVNSDIHASSSLALLINFVLQFLYLYFNFSGYTDIVLGVSRLFGINLLNNFSRPLFANNVTEYWKRWHISLTTWCNDYIFKRIILKRMKWKRWASVYAVFVTFLIIGIWHGASWNFVILGLLQGIALNYEYFTKKFRISIGKEIPQWINTAVSRLLTILFICVSHVFFFTRNLQDAVFYFSSMFKGTGSDKPFSFYGLGSKDLVLIVAGIIIVLISEFRDEKGKKSIKGIILNNKILFWLTVIMTIALLLVTALNKNSGFIYEQF